MAPRCQRLTQGNTSRRALTFPRQSGCKRRGAAPPMGDCLQSSSACRVPGAAVTGRGGTDPPCCSQPS